MRKLGFFDSLPKEKQDWLLENFSKYPNKVLAEMLDTKYHIIRNIGHKYNLKKPKDFWGFKKNTVAPCHWAIMSPEIREAAIRKLSESHKKLYARERARVTFGLEQKSKLRIIRMSRTKINLRYNLKRKGYIMDPYSYGIIYYSDSTIRNPIREKHAAECDIKILPLPKNFNANGIDD